MRWAGLVSHMGKKMDAYGFFGGKARRKETTRKT
jgi:hypothetical protein